MSDETLLPKEQKRQTESPDSGGGIPPQTFRAGVGALIVDREGRVLLLERRDRAGSWQMAQGGLDPGETPEEGVRREVEEETGIEAADLRLLGAVDRLLAYELPVHLRHEKIGRGQVQYWFIFLFTGTDGKITLGDGEEFSAWRWSSIDEAVEKVVDFKKPLYRELAEYYRRAVGR